MHHIVKAAIFGVLSVTGGVSAAEREVPHGVPPAAMDLRYADATLAELARDAQRRGGIVIEYPAGYRADVLKRDAHAKDWEEGLRQLLGGYNYVSVHAPDGALQRIIIQARQQPVQPRPASNGKSAKGPSSAVLFVADPAAAKGPPPAQLSGLNPRAIRAIKLPVDRLSKMKPGDTLSVKLGDRDYKLVHDQAQAHDTSDRTWIGYVDLRGKAYRAVLTYRADGAITGQINTPEGLFEIVQFEGTTWVVDLNASGLAAGSLEHDQLLATPGSKMASALELSQPATARSPATIDLMVLHTRPAEAQPVMRANHLVAATQQAFADSGAFVNLRLVRVERVDYTDNNGNLAALEDLSRNRLGVDVAAMRKRYGADVVILLRPFRSSAQGSCGVSWVGGSNHQPLTADAGFAVVSDGFDDRYFCHAYTFAHELGHVFGNVHDAEISPQGIFPFSYAWAIAGKFATIMSYRFDVAPLVGKFANPEVPCTEKGLPCGRRGLADNARTINLTAPSVANYMPTAAD